MGWGPGHISWAGSWTPDVSSPPPAGPRSAHSSAAAAGFLPARLSATGSPDTASAPGEQEKQPQGIFTLELLDSFVGANSNSDSPLFQQPCFIFPFILPIVITRKILNKSLNQTNQQRGE